VNSSRFARAFLIFGSTAILASPLFADAPAESAQTSPTPAGRVVIRGSGSDVRLERETKPPVARREFAPSRNPLLEDVVRMSKGGVSDAVVVAYLTTHRRELPKILSQDDQLRLQRGGVSDSVMTYLSRNSAVDIGVTGEGGRGGSVYAVESPSQEGYEAYDAAAGYPFYGGYSYFPVRIRPRPFPKPHPSPHPAHPISQAPHPQPMGFGMSARRPDGF